LPNRRRIAGVPHHLRPRGVDIRIFVNFLRSTTDGRIAMGKSGSQFFWAGRVGDRVKAAQDRGRRGTQLDRALARLAPPELVPIL
jgi:hypothetical protein